MSSLVNPRWEEEVFQRGILLIVGAAASGQTKGQVPGEIPKWLTKLCTADPVSDPRAAALVEKYPGRVRAFVGEAKDVAPGLLEERLPLVVMSHVGQMWNSSPKEWSILLGIPEKVLATLQEQGRLVLLGLGCGAPPIADWENLFKAFTRENVALLAKARQIVPLARGNAPCFYRLTNGVDKAYPGWAVEAQKQEVAALLGDKLLPEAHDYPALFKERVEAILEKPVADPAKALAEEAKDIKTHIDKMWEEMVGDTPDVWANRQWE